MPLAFVTGASGFVGQALTRTLLARGWAVRAGTRSPPKDKIPGLEWIHTGELDLDAGWSEATQNVDVFFHLAARVHQMQDPAPDPLSEYRRVNALATERLARLAVGGRARRFVFISSVKVNGEARGSSYTEDDPPAPADPYGVSKWEAELALRRVAEETGLSVVVVRPPLVYGPGVRANVLRLIRAVDRGLPLPFGGIDNRRSFLFVENLIDALLTCAVRPEAAGRTYLLSDGDDLSTPALVRVIAAALGRPARLVDVPAPLLRFALGMVGRSSAADRLLGSLTVNTSRIRRELNWNPPYSVADGMAQTGKWYRGLISLPSSTHTDR